MSATIIQFPVRKNWSKSRVYRLTRTLVFLIALVFIAGQVLSGQSSAVATDSLTSSSFQYVVVMPGDNLWAIAEKAAPDQNTADYVQAIISLNNLETSNVEVGQRLALPSN